MTEALTQGLAQITEAHGAIGIYGAIGAAIVVVLRLYRLPMLQGVLPALVQWANLKKWVKLAVVFVAAAVASAVAALVAGGAAWPVVVGGAFVAGLMALGVNEGTEGAADILAVVVPEGYKRSKAGQVTSILLPMPAELQAPELISSDGEVLDV